MDPLRTIFRRFEAHQSLTYLLIRVFLGFALFIRGWIFIGDQEVLMSLLLGSGLEWAFPNVLIHYITLAHLVGGFMLAVGLLTRVAALAQIPILVGAVFFVHWQEGLFAASQSGPGQSLELAVLVLFLLVLVFLSGPGRFSVDHYIFGKKEEARAEELPSFGLPPSGILAPGPRPLPRPQSHREAAPEEAAPGGEEG